MRNASLYQVESSISRLPDAPTQSIMAKVALWEVLRLKDGGQLMPVVRGLFTVTSQKIHKCDSTFVEIELSAQYSGTPEDNTYASLTPTGSIKMAVTNPSAVAALPVGGRFYVDFTPVPTE